MASLLPDVAADETVVRVNEAQKGGNQLVSVLYGRNERTVYLIRNRTLLARTLSAEDAGVTVRRLKKGADARRNGI